MSAAEAGRPAAQAQTRWRRSAADRCALGPGRKELEQPDLHRPTGCQVSQRAGPVVSTGWVGQSGASAHGSTAQQWPMEWLLPRQGCRTAVIREQEGGVWGGGAANPEADTPAPAARARRRKMRRTNRGRDLRERDVRV